MKSIQQQWVHGTLLLCLFHSFLAFQPQTTTTSLSSCRKNIQTVAASNLLQQQAVIDPNDIIANSISHHDPETLPALLSTMLSTAIQPAAHGHSNPLFGPPDPHLEQIKSIAPSAKALSDMGITHAKSVQEMIPNTSEEFQNAVTATLKKGWKVLDINDLKITAGRDPLPGFAQTNGILPTRTPAPESLGSFAAEAKWAAKFFNVMDKLPFAALWYALIEFGFLRRNVDLFKEDIEADPVGVMADTISVTVVRCAAIAVLTIILVTFFG